ncbi:MAG TPA: cysteine hydrolase [Candidatus Lustribacter sp.]
MRTLPELILPPKSAVIVVDVQNDFCRAEGALGKAGEATAAALEMIPNLQRLLTAARTAGTAVIFVRTIHESVTDSAAWTWRMAGNVGGCCRKNTWGAEFTEVAPLPDEPVVIKHRYSAFINTRLDSVLRTLKIENLIMTGVSTNVCVESTARHGYMLDYNIVFMSDCTAAFSTAEHEMALYNMRTHFGVVATADEVIAAWDAVPALAPA